MLMEDAILSRINNRLGKFEITAEWIERDARVMMVDVAPSSFVSQVAAYEKMHTADVTLSYVYTRIHSLETVIKWIENDVGVMKSSVVLIDFASTVTVDE